MSADQPPPASDRQTPPAKSRTHWLVWLFAAVGLLGLLAMIFLAYSVSRIGGRYQPAEVAGEAPETRFVLGNVHELRGTNFIQLDIAASAGGPSSGSLSRGPRDDVRNILLLDKSSGASRKLLPDNERQIVQTTYLSAAGDLYETADADLTAGGDKDEAPLAYYLLLVRQSGREDLHDMLVGTLASGKQAYVMRGIDGVDSIWMHSATRIGMIVRERLHLYYRIVDIPSLKVVQSRRIEIG